jgi:uncharacterized damage-inducible protein DinB
MHQQYNLIKDARQVLLQYCSTITPKDFIQEHNGYGIGSIRNQLVHIGNCYEGWIGKQALQKDLAFTPKSAIQNMEEVNTFFESIDQLMEEFFQRYLGDFDTKIIVDSHDQKTIVSASKLFTHVITHEFHHKGQILSLSRQLGYTPVDTDVMR